MLCVEETMLGCVCVCVSFLEEHQMHYFEVRGVANLNIYLGFSPPTPESQVTQRQARQGIRCVPEVT